MSSRSPRGKRSLASASVLLGLAVSAPIASAAPSVPSKPIDPRLLNVKFRDDTKVDVARGELRFASAGAQARLDRLLGTGKASISTLIQAEPATLDHSRALLEARGKDVPDLTAWVRVRLADDVDPAATVAALKADPLVEHVYAPVKLRTTTLTTTQQAKLTSTASKYMGTGPTGLGVHGVANIPGALGDNVDVVDLDYDANIDHEDLVRTPATVDTWWPNPRQPPYPEYAMDRNHGTMTMGVIAAKRDGQGVDGIAPNARVHLASGNAFNKVPTSPDGPPEGYGEVNVMFAAYERLAPGSVLVLEFSGWGSVESDPVVADVIRTATANGIITVEPAGNEGDNYDDPKWAGTSLAPGGEDTGAIIVGAGKPLDCWASSFPPRHKMAFSGYGSRVDVQAPGGCVATISSESGSGGQFAEYGTNPNDGYTYSYSGTSSASAVIGGVVAALSGAYQERVGKPLTPALARATLKDPALSQPQDTSVNSGHIGPLPNLTAAINAIAVPDATAPSQPGPISVVSNGGTNVNLSWTAATDAIGVTHYEVRRGGMPLDITTTTSISDRKVVPGESYTYSVYAVDRAGNRSAVRTLNVTAAVGTAPTDVQPPTSPASLVVAPASPDSTNPNGKVSLAWSAATDNVGISRYEIRRNGVRIALVGTSPTPYADTAIQPGVYYRYEVVAVDAAGNRSAPTAPAGATTVGPRGDLIAPTLSTPPSAAALDRTVLLTWAAGADAVGGLTYEVRRSTSASGPYTVIDHTANPNYIDAKVAPNTPYFYRVTAVDGAGNRSVPLTTNVTTAAFAASPDTTPPVTPISVDATLDSANQPVANWLTTSDDTGVARYQVRRNGLYVSSAPAAAVSSAGDTTAKKGRYAVYSVVAFDAAGNASSASAPTGVAPAPTP